MRRELDRLLNLFVNFLKPYLLPCVFDLALNEVRRSIPRTAVFALFLIVISNSTRYEVENNSAVRGE
jgi:hypothetical protein